MQSRPRHAAIVLAAGSGSRFGGHPGAKLIAHLDGEPILGRVLATVRAFEPACTIVVLGDGAEDITQAIEWQGEMRIRNHLPELGISSSLQTGLHALTIIPEAFDGAFIVLGDQPRLEVETMRDLEHASATQRPADRTLVVPLYDEPGPRNPCLLLRPAWGLVDELQGDIGLAPIIEANPDQVLEVRAAGSMPDVDTTQDLKDIAEDLPDVDTPTDSDSLSQT